MIRDQRDYRLAAENMRTSEGCRTQRALVAMCHESATSSESAPARSLVSSRFQRHFKLERAQPEAGRPQTLTHAATRVSLLGIIETARACDSAGKNRLL